MWCNISHTSPLKTKVHKHHTALKMLILMVRFRSYLCDRSEQIPHRYHRGPTVEMKSCAASCHSKLECFRCLRSGLTEPIGCGRLMSVKIFLQLSCLLEFLTTNATLDSRGGPHRPLGLPCVLKGPHPPGRLSLFIDWLPRAGSSLLIFPRVQNRDGKDVSAYLSHQTHFDDACQRTCLPAYLPSKPRLFLPALVIASRHAEQIGRLLRQTPHWCQAQGQRKKAFFPHLACLSFRVCVFKHPSSLHSSNQCPAGTIRLLLEDPGTGPVRLDKDLFSEQGDRLLTGTLCTSRRNLLQRELQLHVHAAMLVESCSQPAS